MEQLKQLGNVALSAAALFRAAKPIAKHSGLIGTDDENVVLLGAQLHGLLHDMKDFNAKTLTSGGVPCIVVAGTQSSGKSTVVNHILGEDLLPVGEQMTTRTPLHIYLHNSHSKNLATFWQDSDDAVDEAGFEEKKVEAVNYSKDGYTIEIGEFTAQGLWQTSFRTTIDRSKAALENVEKQSARTEAILAIRQRIEAISTAKAGVGISSEPISIRIMSAKTPELKIVDLPGMVVVARTAKGQSSDMPAHIKSLIESHIENNSNIILAVMAARPDLETDMVMDIIKRHDPNRLRTIGVLTKVDLLPAIDSIIPYLHNNVDDLALWGGYYALKGRTRDEIAKMDIEAGLAAEAAWFAANKTISQLSEDLADRVGTANLIAGISAKMADHLRKLLPDILDQLETRKQLLTLQVRDNPPPPTDRREYIATAVKILTTLTTQAVHEANRGELGVAILKHIKKLPQTPIGCGLWNEKRLQDVIDNCIGLSMQHDPPLTMVLEKIIEVEKPFDAFMASYTLCADNVFKLIETYFTDMLSNVHWIGLRNEFEHQIKRSLTQWRGEVRDLISILVANDAAFIWTDRDPFIDPLADPFADRQDKNDKIPRAVERYLADVGRKMGHVVGKAIVAYSVRRLDTLQTSIQDHLHSRKDLASFFSSDGIELTRIRCLHNELGKIERALNYSQLILKTN